MRSFKDWQGKKKKKPGRAELPADTMYPHKDIAQVYENLISYREFKDEGDMVQVEGYGKVTRRQAKDLCIEKLQSIIQTLQTRPDQTIDYGEFDLSKAFYVAYRS
jgi:hypothetical protein